jgi:UDP-2,3-diacylglucosamine pyrophosphatase LpxH
MKIAAISDLHLSFGAEENTLGPSGFPLATELADFRLFLKFVRHLPVDHLIICGDILESLNVEDDWEILDPFRSMLRYRGFYRFERCTFVPGNHDYVPGSEDIERWVTLDREKSKVVHKLIEDLDFAGSVPNPRDPFLKEFSDIVIIGLNTPHRSVWGGWNGGKLGVRKMRIFRKLLKSASASGKQIIVAMYHRPKDLEDECDFLEAIDKKDVIIICGHEHANKKLEINPAIFCVGGFATERTCLVMDIRQDKRETQWQRWDSGQTKPK